MSVTLYDQFGRPIREEKKPEQRPLAVAPLMDTFREYVTDGLTPERLAAVFKEADQGDMRRQAHLFEQLEEKDGHLLCERDKRKNVILDLERKVEPASDDSRDGKVAEFVEDFFDHHADWDDSLVAMQDAVGKGYSGLEAFWDVSEGQALPAKFEFIEQKRFQYTDAKGVLRRYPLLLTDDDPMGVEIPSWKVILHQYGGKSGHPTRSGIYRVAAWMTLFKHYAIKDWIIFCEVYGMPLRLGKYNQGASGEDKQALINAISSLGSDAAGIISKSTEIEFVESAKGSTAADLWKLLASFCNGENSKAILGQTLTSEVDGKGSYAASQTHNEVRLDLLRSDGRALAATIRDQLIRPLVGFNFGWDTYLPKFSLTYREDEDLAAKADWLDKVTSKVAVPAKWYRSQFNIPAAEKGEETIGGLQPVPQTLKGAVPTAAKMIVASDKPASFTQEQQALEDLADLAMDQVSLSDNEQQILEAVQGADSYEQAIENLLELYPELDMSSLQETVERAIFSAEVFGRKVGQDSDQT